MRHNENIMSISRWEGRERENDCDISYQIEEKVSNAIKVSDAI